MDHRGNLPDLDSLRCFVEAARLLNFRAASKAVGLTPAALGQRIKQLEDQLGAKLFHRTTRKVELTEAGFGLVDAANTALDSAFDCVRAARGELGPVTMDLKVGTRHELGLSWIVPMLPRLADAHPGITVHLYFGSGPDLELRTRTQEIDCAISSRRTTDPKVDGIRIHREDYVLVGSPDLVARVPFDTVADARNHVVIDTSIELALFRYWRDAPDGDDTITFKAERYMGTIAAIRAAVVAQLGVAVLPEYLIRPDVAAGRLVPLLADVEPVSDWFRLIHRKDDPRVSLLRAIAETMRTVPLA